MALLFITHDLNLVRAFHAPRRRDGARPAGRDRAPPPRCSRDPQHAYTQQAARQPAAARGRAARRRRAGAAARRATSACTSRIGAGLVPQAPVRGGAPARRCSCGAARRWASSANRARARPRWAWRCWRCSRSPAARCSLDGQRIDNADRAALRAMRRRMQVVFQDPFASLSPRMTIGQIVGEGLALHRPGTGRRRARPAGAGDARRGRPDRARGVGRRAAALSARVLRRPAPAHRDRARGRAAARGAGARRADLGARRVGAAAGAGAAGRAAARATA